MSRRRKYRRNGRKSKSTDWGKVVLWGLGLGAGLFVLTGAAGISMFSKIAQPLTPTQNLENNAAGLLNQLISKV